MMLTALHTASSTSTPSVKPLFNARRVNAYITEPQITVPGFSQPLAVSDYLMLSKRYQNTVKANGFLDLLKGVLKKNH